MRQITAIATMALLVGAAGCMEIAGPDVDISAWPQGDGFERIGLLEQGSQVEIKGVFGAIRAIPAAGSEFVVRASKTGPSDKLAHVSIEIVRHSGGITFCAVYPDVPGQRPNECAPGDIGNTTVQDSVPGAVHVSFVVEIPVGVSFIGRTIVGSVDVADLRSDAFVQTVLGNIHVSTSEIATARTVSGSVVASIGDPDLGRDLSFAAVSGDVTLTVPAATNAWVELSAGRGDITSDVPLTETSPGTAEGAIGNGGPTVSLSSAFGDVTLRRQP